MQLQASEIDGIIGSHTYVQGRRLLEKKLLHLQPIILLA